MLEIEKHDDILKYCYKNNIRTKDFNEPVKILDGANCNGLFSRLDSFNQDVIIPENVHMCDLNKMFFNCHSFNSKVIFKSDKDIKYYNMNKMFDNCCSLEKIDLDVSMQKKSIFKDCYNLKEVTLRIHNTSKHLNLTFPSDFTNCINLKKINCESKMNILSKSELFDNMLYGLLNKEIICSLSFLRTFSDSVDEDIAMGFYNEKDHSLFSPDMVYSDVYGMSDFRWSRLYKYIDRPAIIKTIKITEKQTRWENEYIPCLYIKVTPEEYAEELLTYNLGGN